MRRGGGWDERQINRQRGRVGARSEELTEARRSLLLFRACHTIIVCPRRQCLTARRVPLAILEIYPWIWEGPALADLMESEVGAKAKPPMRLLADINASVVLNSCLFVHYTLPAGSTPNPNTYSTSSSLSVSSPSCINDICQLLRFSCLYALTPLYPFPAGSPLPCRQLPLHLHCRRALWLARRQSCLLQLPLRPNSALLLRHGLIHCLADSYPTSSLSNSSLAGSPTILPASLLQLFGTPDSYHYIFAVE